MAVKSLSSNVMVVIESMWPTDGSHCISNIMNVTYWVSVAALSGKIPSGAQLVARFPSPAIGGSAREGRRS